MDHVQRKAIEQECRDLVIAITQHGDHKETEKCIALFAEDGTWLRGGKPYKGHAEIRSSYRASTQVTRHINGGTLVHVIDDSHAESVTYYIALHHDPKVDAKVHALLRGLVRFAHEECAVFGMNTREPFVHRGRCATRKTEQLKCVVRDDD